MLVKYTRSGSIYQILVDSRGGWKGRMLVQGPNYKGRFAPGDLCNLNRGVQHKILTIKTYYELIQNS
jgi:hypothetical protein